MIVAKVKVKPGKWGLVWPPLCRLANAPGSGIDLRIDRSGAITVSRFEA